MSDIVRFVGLVLFLLGAAGTAYTVRASFEHRRPLDVVFALAAPLALLAALAGALLLFVPGFF